MNRLTTTFVRLTIVLALCAAALGCATIHPWDRDLLAEKKMSLNPNAMVRSIDDHIYFSKEGSTGGTDVGGGGCGCN